MEKIHVYKIRFHVFFFFSFLKTILYTLSEDILQKISENDESYDSIIENSYNEMFQKNYNDRPLTADISVSIIFFLH